MFFLFFKKCNINIEILAFLFPLHQFFNKSCFSSLSINAKQKFWGVSHLLHMCVIFPKRISFWAYNMGPIQPKITQSYITLSAFKIFVNILAWYGVIIRHCHFSQFSKKNYLFGQRAIRVKIRQPYSNNLLFGDFYWNDVAWLDTAVRPMVNFSKK